MKVAFYLEKEIANHSSIPAWKIPWTEEAGGLQSVALHELNATAQPHVCKNAEPWFLHSDINSYLER